MPELVGTCPRCGAQSITFDLTQATLIGQRYSWMGIWEAFCVCRRCHRATIFILHQDKVDGGVLQSRGLGTINGAANDYVQIHTYVNISNIRTRPSPEHLPDAIDAAFQEGARCLAVGCFNAAAAMFRLSLDLATKNRLPSPNAEDSPDDQTRRFLARRLQWLFDNGTLPESLRELSSIVKDEGNTAAHEGAIDKAAATDLVEFTERLLSQLYTEPTKIRLAMERRSERKACQAKSSMRPT